MGKGGVRGAGVVVGGMESNRSWIWDFFGGDENVLELVVTAQPFKYILKIMNCTL